MGKGILWVRESSEFKATNLLGFHSHMYHGHSLNSFFFFALDHCLAVFHGLVKAFRLGVGIINFRDLNVRSNYETTFFEIVKLF